MREQTAKRTTLFGSIAELLHRLAPTANPSPSASAVRENQDMSLQVHLAEYNSLRQEMNMRLQAHHQTFNYLIVVIGAAVAAAVAASTATTPVWVLLPIGAILLPLITAPLALILFDHEMVLNAIGSYIWISLRARIAAIIGDDQILHNVWEFKHLPLHSRRIYYLVLTGRWILFLVPIFLPLIGLIVYTAMDRGWWRMYLDNLGTCRHDLQSL